MAESSGADKVTVGAVEVLKDETTRVWYSGQVLDMVGKEKLLVGFDGDVWPKGEFPFSRVRKAQKLSQAELDRFNPRIGDEVELRCNASEHNPASWGTAIVKNIKHGFFFVNPVSNLRADGQSEAIVEKAMLRPSIRGGCFDTETESLKQESFKIAPVLKEWVNTEDALGCFTRLENDTGLMFIKVGRNDLKLFGSETSIKRAKMLLDVHVKHQVQIQNFQDVREKRLDVLEKRRNRIEGTGYKHSIEIQIDPSFVRRVIGKNGETIRSVSQKYDVNIHIVDTENEDEPTRTVRIFGNSMDNINKARGEVEFVEEVYPETIDPEMFNWIRGRGDRTIRLFKETTGIMYARLDRDTQQLYVCGSRNAVEEAMAMFETHLMYFPVFNQMDEEMEDLLAKLEEYGDWNARREWSWYQNQDNNDDEYSGGKSSSSKGKSKGGKGKDNSKGDSWRDSWKGENGKGENGWKGDSKGKGRGGKSKGGRGKGWRDDEDDDDDDDRPAMRSKKGEKGAGRGGPKGTGKGKRQEESEEDSEDEPQPKGRGRGRGAGRGPRKEDSEDEPQPKGRGRGRGAGRGPRKDDGELPPPPPAPKDGASRKMGKKGMRS